MLCQKCHKNLATVRYAEVVDGKVTDQHLCFECMSNHQKNASLGFELAGPPTAAHSKSAKAVDTADSARGQRTCPACGTRLSRVLEQGVVGCTQCYTSFSEDIQNTLEGLHRALQHKGKAPRTNDDRARMRAELQAKRALLRSMLRAERYEEAAALRDTIKNLESGLSMPELSAR
jgi:protein arginine kinase activator